jgi:hypothetical protein
VRRLTRWVIGLASALAVWRLWSRRRQVEPKAEEPDPAEALRRKLAETRDDVGPEPAAPEAPEAPAETIDERRARVHAKAQETIESMREGDA